MVGELCAEGTCTIEALGGTVMFSVNNDNWKNYEKESPYKLEVLTLITNVSNGN